MEAERDWEKLVSSLVANANELRNKHPSSALVYCRQAAEAILLSIFEEKYGNLPEKPMSIQDLLSQKLGVKDEIPMVRVMEFNTIQMWGNFGAHFQNEGHEIEQVQHALNPLLNLIQWRFNTIEVDSGEVADYFNSDDDEIKDIELNEDEEDENECDTGEQIDKLTVDQLKSRLSDLGLPVSGKKAVLVNRLNVSMGLEGISNGKLSSPFYEGTHWLDIRHKMRSHWWCRKCDFISQDWVELKKHLIENNHINSDYTCTKCDKTILSGSDWNKHFDQTGHEPNSQKISAHHWNVKAQRKYLQTLLVNSYRLEVARSSDEWVDLARIGAQMKKIDADFSLKDWRLGSMTRLVEKFDHRFEIRKRKVRHSRKPLKKPSVHEIRMFEGEIYLDDNSNTS